uniref:Uncharacterized protein n=1 Tax=Sparassis latifolia TaxID=1202976 RepID=A0A6B9LTP8_9APHY|nr:hypothetical protein [Sparassis latifolia]
MERGCALELYVISLGAYRVFVLPARHRTLSECRTIVPDVEVRKHELCGEVRVPNWLLMATPGPVKFQGWLEAQVDDPRDTLGLLSLGIAPLRDVELRGRHHASAGI